MVKISTTRFELNLILYQIHHIVNIYLEPLMHIVSTPKLPHKAYKQRPTNRATTCCFGNELYVNVNVV